MELLTEGDVIVVRTSPGNRLARLAGRLIRLGAALRDQDDLVDHVAIVHHVDAAGILWAIEGRPGGVGWVDVAEYDNQYLLSTAAQPKTDAQRKTVCAAAAGLLGVGYDWAAIGMDAADALGLDHLWRSGDWYEKPPAHVVCSSLAAWAYRQAGLAEPDRPMVRTTPADWAEFILAKGWQR